MKKYKSSFYNVFIKKDKIGRTLLYNTNTTALCWFTEEILNTFYEKTGICENSILMDIIKQGFVVREEIDEVSQIENERMRFIYNSQPAEMRYVIAPTMLCNMNCTYCFENDVHKKTSMSLEDAKVVVDFIVGQLNANNNVKKLYIFWFGGEPTIGMEVIKYISKSLIEYSTQRKIKYNATMASNGLLLNKDNALLLKNICKIRFVQITLDGLAETYGIAKGVNKNVFYNVVDNIEKICGIMGVNIRINVSKNNQSEIIPLVQYLLAERKLRGKIEIYLAHLRGYCNNDVDCLMGYEEFQEYRRKVEDYFIELGYIESIQHSLKERTIVSCSSMQMMSAAIGPDLRLYRCEHCYGKEELSIGNCEDGFFRNRIDNMFINYQMPQECKECKFFPACGTGCRDEQVIQQRDVDCNAMKKRLLNNIENYIIYQEKLKNGEIIKTDIFEVDDKC